MTLIRTSLLSLVALAVRLLSMLALNKILALQIGPAGYGMVGQIQNLVTAITSAASAGVGTGVTKYTSEYHENSIKQFQVWITAVFLGVICSIIVSFNIILFRNEFSKIVFNNTDYAYLFIWIAAFLILYVFNALLLSIINGLTEIKLFVAANISNSLISLAVIGLMTWFYGLQGALIALAINQSIACIATVVLVRRKKWFRIKNFIGHPSWATAFNLSKFTLMAVGTSVVGPLSLIMVRNIIVEHSGLAATGHWEAMVRVSNILLMFFTAPLSVYYLPKLSALTATKDMKRELLAGLKLLLPFAAVMALTIYYMRSFVIRSLFSDDFAAMSSLFAWQLIGDVIRASAWLFSFFMISRAMVKEFLFIEITSAVIFVLLCNKFIVIYGVAGTGLAYIITNSFALIFSAFMTHLVLSKNNKDKNDEKIKHTNE